MPDPDGAPGAPYVLSLALAWSYYGAAVLVNVLAWKIYIPALFYLYLAAGFLMTRFVMQRLVEWHPVYNTVHNVFSAKLGMFFLWPFKMLSLLLKLSVNKVL